MGRICLAVVITAGIGVAELAIMPSEPAIAASGLVAAYAFDAGSGSTVADTSGNGNNGTITNATWSTSGKYGDALKFNGTSALVTIPDAASLQLSTGMTLEAWVNPSTSTRTGVMWSTRATTTTTCRRPRPTVAGCRTRG